MGQLSQHPGHKAVAHERIEKAREHYETRASRRPKQTWPKPGGPDDSSVGPRDGRKKRGQET